MPTAKLNRTVLRIAGEGAAAWLEGLITNSLSGDLTFAAMLTPQGKIIADFFVWQNPNTPDDVIIDTPEKFGSGLFKRLKMYRLRAPITLEDVSDNSSVYISWESPNDAGRADPRNQNITRILSTEPVAASASEEDWDRHRLSIGLPDSEWDFGSAEVFPANANMDRLSGVDFKKGCFVGQEVVSRMHRKANIKKRLCAFKIHGDLEGRRITASERVIGEILHTRGHLGMAMIRFDRLEKTGDTPLKSGDAAITLIAPPTIAPSTSG